MRELSLYEMHSVSGGEKVKVKVEGSVTLKPDKNKIKENKEILAKMLSENRATGWGNLWEWPSDAALACFYAVMCAADYCSEITFSSSFSLGIGN